MTKQSKATLKGYFNTGDILTESNVADLIDSLTPPSASLVVAASDAPQRVIDYADYVCDGTDDQVQIQAAIDALPTAGGKVQLSEGTFVIGSGGTLTADGLSTPYGILITENHPPLTLEGMPGATTIRCRDGVAVDYMHMILNAGAEATPRTNTTYYRGIKFFGNSVPSVCLGSLFAHDISVEACQFQGANYFMVHFLCITQRCSFSNNLFLGKNGLRVENNDFRIINNTFNINGEASGTSMLCSLAPDWDRTYTVGVKYTHYSSSVIGNSFIGGDYQLVLSGVRCSTIVGNAFTDQNNGAVPCLQIVSVPVSDGGGFDSFGNIVTANTFVNGLYAMQIKGDGTGSNYNIVSNNTIINGLDRNFAWGIVEGGGSNTGNIICDNYIPNLGGGTLAATGTGVVVRGNSGYKGEADGAAATVADGGTITHGCAAAPTRVSLTGSVAGEIVTATSISATTITVAIKKHDGTAGTSQTIYWSAKV